MIDDMMSVVLTAMSCLPARCAPRGDRAIERVVFEVRTEIANIAQQKADEYGEPPLSKQG
jgi:transposase